ncbi:helix-hairpin-helix domain-containing protein, partial [bacterium]|nr:helix-hairpin-helix domain-containing protein [bacterium]
MQRFYKIIRLTGRRFLLPLMMMGTLYTQILLYCQTESEENLLEEQTEAAASELMEYLQSLRLHPLDLNRGTLQNLQLIPFLSPLQAKNIIAERSKKGLFQSWSDFQERTKLDEELCMQLKQYLTITEKKDFKQESMEFRGRIQTHFPKSEGYSSGKYPGSSLKIVERIHFSLNYNTRGGLLIEKDPGENQWNDHIAGFIENNHLLFLSKCLVGNYRVEVGQGLVFWGPYGFSQGADPAAFVKKRSTGTRGYTYADENNFLTGIAVEAIYQSFYFQIFASSTRLDATSNEDGTISTLSSSGLHRTESEMNNRDRLKETLLGVRFTKNWPWGTVGFTGYQNQYSNKIKKSDLSKYRFYFQGDKNHVVGIDYDIFFSQLNLSGEIAQSRSHGWALVTNCMLNLGKSSLVLSYRRFTPDFHNLHSHSFGISPACNEEGFYIGFSGRIASSVRISFYYDLYKKPWRTYSIPVPTRGNDLFVQFEKKFSPTLYVTVRTRLRRGELLETGETVSGIKIDHLQNRIHSLFRFELRFQPSARLRFRNRIETVKVDYPTTHQEVSTFISEETG